MNRHIWLLVTAMALSSCSGGADDVLADIGDVSVPDRLTGCVLRNDDGETCDKAVCVKDEESDCKSWVKACEKFDHVTGVQNGIDTCTRKGAVPDS